MAKAIRPLFVLEKASPSKLINEEAGKGEENGRD
jgi:hypothetical protein